MVGIGFVVFKFKGQFLPASPPDEEGRKEY